MQINAVNLGVRFVLELAVLAALGIWGWQLSEGPFRYLLVWAFPLLAAAVWGTFAVPGDPSRSGNAPIPIPGILRLVLELFFFATATFIYYQLEYIVVSCVMGSVVFIHYLISHKRITWLLKGSSNKS